MKKINLAIFALSILTFQNGVEACPNIRPNGYEDVNWILSKLTYAAVWKIKLFENGATVPEGKYSLPTGNNIDVINAQYECSNGKVTIEPRIVEPVNVYQCHYDLVCTQEKKGEKMKMTVGRFTLEHSKQSVEK